MTRDPQLPGWPFARPASLSRNGFRHRAPHGFSLVELVVIMVLVGILAFVALPRFDLLWGFDEIGHRDQVRATLEYARKSAVAQRRHVQITTAANTMTVSMSSIDPDTITAASWPIAFARPLTLPGSSSNAVTPPSGGTLVASVSPLAFDPLGRPLDAATGAALALAASFTVSGSTVTVEAETGHVH